MSSYDFDSRFSDGGSGKLNMLYTACICALGAVIGIGFFIASTACHVFRSLRARFTSQS